MPSGPYTGPGVHWSSVVVINIAESIHRDSYTEEFIHLFELRAVIHTLRAFQTHLQAHVVHLLCDNTVFVAAIREGFSHSEKMRAVLCTLQLLLLQAVVLHISKFELFEILKFHNILMTIFKCQIFYCF